MANLTRAHVAHLHSRAQSLHKRVEKMKGHAEKMTGKFVRSLEVGTAALVGGVIEGKAGPTGAHVMGVPVTLGAGLALNLLGYFDAAGEHSDHLNNLGDGFLGSYLSSVGFGMGTRWSQTGKLLGGGATDTSTQGAISPQKMGAIASKAMAQTAAAVPQQQAIPIAG